MTDSRTAPIGVGSGRGELIARFVAFSALAGLLLGIFEAALLRSSPRVPALLVPDIGPVEWFLAPLLDMACFALWGLALGWLAARSPGKFPASAFVAADVAAVAVFVAMRLRWLHERIVIKEFAFGEDVLVPLACFVAAFGVALALVWLMRKPVSALSGRVRFPLVRFISRGLALAGVVALCGVGYFLIRPFPGPTRLQAASDDRPQPPNIVFIVLDTVRADHLSSYGYSRPTTPNLDRLAARGVLFENAIAPTSWTLASHASMFTGLLPHQNGADWWLPLPAGPRTLAEILRSRGYTTAGFVGNFDYCQRGWGIGRGFDTYVDASDSFRHNLTATLAGTAIVQPVYQHFFRFDYLERQTASEMDGKVFRWLQQGPQQPYFLFLNYFDVHVPYLTEPPYDQRFGKVSVGMVHRLFDDLQTPGPPRGITASDGVRLMAAYDNCLAYLDAQVGRLLDRLRDSPEGRNTIVIVTSDHGEEFGEQGYYSHGYNLYREALHVPLIIAGPGVPQGVRVQHIVRTRDLFSTVLDLAAGGNSPFSRESLARFWHPGFKPQPFDDFVVSELVPIFNEGGTKAMISLTTPEWQYIYDSGGRQELYRWTQDPLDQMDLARFAGSQAVMAGLHQQLIQLIADSSGPWLDQNYLFARGPSRSSFLLDVLSARKNAPPSAPGRLFIGASQSFFTHNESPVPIRPTTPDQELLKTLPYH